MVSSWFATESVMPILFVLFLILSFLTGAIEGDRSRDKIRNTKHSMFLDWCEIQQKVFPIFDIIFHAYLKRGLQKYARNLIPTMAF